MLNPDPGGKKYANPEHKKIDSDSKLISLFSTWDIPVIDKLEINRKTYAGGVLFIPNAMGCMTCP